MFCLSPSEELISYIYIKIYMNVQPFLKCVNVSLRERNRECTTQRSKGNIINQVLSVVHILTMIVTC